MRWRGSSGGSSRSRTGSASGRDWDWKWEEGRSREREREESLVNYASLEVSTAVAAGHDANRKPGSQAGPSSLSLIEPDVLVIRLVANHQLTEIVFSRMAYSTYRYSVYKYLKYCKHLVQRSAGITSA